jgi:UDP-N-acetylglucosamine--N-acetylmuramyl-(pentapeptide) pyrophosphoryl-undecaprenol N-acetylglucosamine transferase
VLVPYPSATADHQTLNARYFAREGGAVLVPESELQAVPALLRSLLADDGRREEMRVAMLRLARPGAAEEIAEELIALAAA